jgi:hypothetical protein
MFSGASLETLALQSCLRFHQINFVPFIPKCFNVKIDRKLHSVGVKALFGVKLKPRPLKEACSYSMICTCGQRGAYEEWSLSTIIVDWNGRVLQAVPDTQHGMAMQSYALPILEDDRLISRFIDEIESKEPQIDAAG